MCLFSWIWQSPNGIVLADTGRHENTRTCSIRAKNCAFQRAVYGIPKDGRLITLTL